MDFKNITSSPPSPLWERGRDSGSLLPLGEEG